MGKLLETERTQFDNTWHSTYGKKCFALLPNTGSFLLLVNTKAHSKNKMSKHYCFSLCELFRCTDPRDLMSDSSNSWRRRNMPFSVTILGIRDEKMTVSIKPYRSANRLQWNTMNFISIIESTYTSIEFFNDC